jgi:hypothetical protein
MRRHKGRKGKATRDGGGHPHLQHEEWPTRMASSMPASSISSRVEPRHENFIGDRRMAPIEGKHRLDLSPATCGPITEVARPMPAGVELG